MYAVGFMHRNEYKYYYGNNALDEFVEYLLSFDKIYNEKKKIYEKIYTVQNTFLISYNGSRFDNYLLFNSILENDIRIKNLLQKESDLFILYAIPGAVYD